MSYEVLARKWRPGGFDEVFGQDHVTTPLRNALRSGRIPHAVLLTGPRGVGKTTLARILARCLNCEKGPTDEPCGACTSCREIAEGRATDVQEIDAASRTSVDDVREIIESVRYAPSPGKHRVYVVDEVHMLSAAAFNALLKTLEEPPPRSLFVFATTNPEKIPFTVVSRCQRYDLRRIGSADLMKRLQEVAGSEGAKLSEASLREIARAAEGSLRDALTLLDQVLAAGGDVDEARVAAVLDLVDRRLLVELVEALVAREPARALEIAARADQSGVEARRLASELLRVLRDLVVLGVGGADADALVDAADAELEALRELAERGDATRLRRMFRALIREMEDLAWAPEPMAVLEMALVRLATLPDDADVAALLGRLESLEQRLGGAGSGGEGPADGGPGTGAGRGGAARGGSRPAPRSGSSRGPGRRSSAPPSEGAERPAARLDGAAEAAGTDAPTPLHPQPPAPAGEDEPAGASATPAQIYDRLRSFAQQRNRGLFAALEGGRLLERGEGTLRIGLPAGLAARRLASRRAELEAISERFFGAPTRVEIEIEGQEAAPHRPDAEQLDAVRESRHRALDHPAVNQALEILEGEILEIRPLGNAP